MRNRNIVRQLQRLRDLIRSVDQATNGNVEIQAHWARYLCVLSAGLLENALVELYSDFCLRTSPAPVASYATYSLGSIQNPKTVRFIEVAERFRVAWGENLTAYVSDNGRRDAIDSIMANRHLIVHGKDSGITLVRVKSYLQKALEVLEFIEDECYR